MKYKVGDEVIIRSDLVAEEFYEDVFCRDKMAKMGGKRAMIIKVEYNLVEYYRVDIDNGLFCWTGEMFERQNYEGEEK